MAEKKDIFYLDKIFPEADKIFSENFKAAEEIIKNGIIVLDTNVLLIPFDTNEKNVSDIKDIYLKYKSENRLFISARTAREFANNRAHKIGDVFLQIRQLKEKINSGNFKINQYPILQNNEDYTKLITEFNLIQKSIKTAQKHLNNLEAHIQSWTWDDNVSLAYKEIFTQDIIIEVIKSKSDLEQDLTFRIEYKVAPGFKDSNKLDEGIGDLIIWQTILEIAKEKNKDVIFVTNDQKNDWFYKQDKIGLYPKYELFDEFRRFTNGKSISIINFVKFLELSDAKTDTINEIKTSIDHKLPKFSQIDPSILTIGLEIEHLKFGNGKISNIDLDNGTVKIVFEKAGTKTFLTKYARFNILDTLGNVMLQNMDDFANTDV